MALYLASLVGAGYIGDRGRSRNRALRRGGRNRRSAFHRRGRMIYICLPLRRALDRRFNEVWLNRWAPECVVQLCVNIDAYPTYEPKSRFQKPTKSHFKLDKKGNLRNTPLCSRILSSKEFLYRNIRHSSALFVFADSRARSFVP